MKIAYIVNQYPKVSHSFIRREIRALEALEFKVLRIAMRGWDAPSPDPEDIREKELTHFVLNRNPLAIVGAVLRMVVRTPKRFFAALALTLKTARCSDRSLLLHLIYLAEACVIAPWLRREGVQHIHAHFGTNSSDVAMLSHTLTGCPYSFTAHGPEEFDRPQSLSLGEKIRRAAFVVAISSFGRSQLYRWVEAGHWRKIKVVRCGVDRDYMKPAVPEFGDELVCVGRLCEQKGQLLLISALHRLMKSGIACKLVLAGDGEFRELLEARIRELGLESLVRITGWISGAQVREELQRARALVLASFAEGLPVVIMEAMAMSKPVISTYVAGIPELVTNGESGWLVPAGDEVRLAKAIEECLSVSNDTLHAMGRTARERVLANHDVGKEAAKLAQLFREHGARKQMVVGDDVYQTS